MSPTRKEKLSKRLHRESPARVAQPKRDLYAELSAPLDPAAYEPFEDGSGWTGIKPAYRTERLNKVLGPDGWEQSEPVIISLEIFRDVHNKTFCDGNGAPIWEAVVKRWVKIHALKKTYYGQGGYKNSDRGNAIKGAATDATGNALKDLIGVEVFKGLKNGNGSGNAAPAPAEGSKVVTGLLEAAYFSAPKPWIMVDGERMFVLAPVVRTAIQKIYAADERADRQSTIKLRTHPEGETLVVDSVEEVPR